MHYLRFLPQRGWHQISYPQGIYWDKDATGKIITNVEIANSLEEEIEELKKKNEADTELIQLGLAVNIIHHEFRHVKQRKYAYILSPEKYIEASQPKNMNIPAEIFDIALNFYQLAYIVIFLLLYVFSQVLFYSLKPYL